jgi:hypothetical protein
MDDKNKNPNQLNIEVPEEVASGVYANFVIVGHNSAEFVVDFVQILPGLPQAKVRSRVIMAPQHAKRLLAALEDNLQKFEAAFGRIPTHDHPGNVPPSFPGGPAGFA